MRILNLTIEGFGPFAGKEQIDLEHLTQEGLFLISGPTGAGKTSILDAICFALYGKVPGSRGKVKQLRSQFATPDTPTRVTLDCEVRGKRFKIERSPSYERPKQRGSGMTTQPSSVSYLEYIGGEWVGLSRKYDEVGQIVEDTVGLNGEQFTRVIMLPQGEFSAFLRAEAADRETILERLFGTERFGRVASILSGMQTDANRNTADIRARRAEKITAMLKSAQIPAIPQLTLSTSLTNVGATATVAFIEEENRLQTAQYVNDLALKRKESSTLHLEELNQRYSDAEHFVKHRGIEQQYSPEAHAQLTQQVQRMREAHRIAPAWDEYQRAQKHVEHVRTQREEAASPFDNRSHELQELLEATHKSRSARSEHERLAAQKKKFEDQLAEYTARRESLTEHVAKTRAELGVFNDPQAFLHTLEQAKNALEESTAVRDRVLEVSSELQRVERICERLSDKIEDARVRVQGAREAYHKIRTERLAGIAGELAAELHHDEACPVCGSTQHPSPARRQQSALGQDDEDQAFSAMSEATERLSEVRNTYATHLATLEELKKQRKQFPETSEIKRQCLHNQAEYNRIQSEYERLLSTREKLQTSLQKAEEDVETVREKQSECEKDSIRVETRLKQVEFDIHLPSSLLGIVNMPAPVDAPGAVALEERVQSLIEQVNKSAQLERELQSRTSDLRTRESEWEVAFTSSIFTELEEFLELRNADVNDASHRLHLMEQQATVLQENRASEWYRRSLTETLTLEQLADLVRTQQRVCEQHATNYEEASNRLYFALEQRNKAQQAREEVFDQEREFEAELEHNERIVELAQIVNATSPSNTRRVTLKSYVLGEMFAQVTQAASERLEVMSRNRYRLEHAYERQTGQSKGGLLLQVVDTFTSEERDPRTLSGGESFMASLSLALGLADTVTAHAGGIELESLFIDEGFGTLDPQALDAVMTVLDELRTRGRSVGVISHVEEMQQSIPCKLEVTPSPTGSTTSVMTSGT